MDNKSLKVYIQSLLTLQCFDQLAKDYSLCSYTGKSEPSSGSPCVETSKLTYSNISNYNMIPLKVTVKRCGDVVVYYETITLKLWKNIKD